MMRNIVICDDETDSQNLLISHLKQYMKETAVDFNITVLSSGEELVKKLPNNTDILLLDIKMGQLSGMEAARILRKQNNHVRIIFITTMTQYALEGYEVHAYGFIKKPVSYEPFRRQLNDALSSLDRQEGHFISISLGTEMLRINVNDILYMEAFKHDILVVTNSGVVKCNTPLVEFENQVKDDSFFRCHKSFLVHHRHIKRIDKDSLIMSNGDTVLLSKHRRKEFLVDFGRFVGEK